MSTWAPDWSGFTLSTLSQQIALHQGAIMSNNLAATSLASQPFQGPPFRHLQVARPRWQSIQLWLNLFPQGLESPTTSCCIRSTQCSGYFHSNNSEELPMISTAPPSAIPCFPCPAIPAPVPVPVPHIISSDCTKSKGPNPKVGPPT